MKVLRQALLKQTIQLRTETRIQPELTYYSLCCKYKNRHSVSKICLDEKLQVIVGYKLVKCYYV